jgi:hypothetical protein
MTVGMRPQEALIALSTLRQPPDGVCCYCRYVCHPLLIWFVLRGPLSHTSLGFLACPRSLRPRVRPCVFGLRLRLCSSVSPMANQVGHHIDTALRIRLLSILSVLDMANGKLATLEHYGDQTLDCSPTMLRSSARIV